VTDPGDAADSAGSYECLTVVSEEPTLSAEALGYSLNSYCHVVPDRYVTLAFFPAGVVLRWFRDQFAFPEVEEAKRSHKNVYDLLTSKLPEGVSGICFTPHFIGSGNPTWNVSATGAIVGLQSDRTRYHLFKAILEGIACELNINLKVLEPLIGRIEMLRTTGGGARSATWLAMRASITGKSVASMCNPEAVCLGAAILGGVAAGIYSDAWEGVRRAVAISHVYEPDQRQAEEYADQVARYNKLYPALAAADLFRG
jgi:xylulokinase